MSKITDLSQLDLNGIYSYADYLTWQFDDALELIRGKIMLMGPAPTSKHQIIVTNLGGQMYDFFRKKRANYFSRPSMCAFMTAGNPCLPITTAWMQEVGQRREQLPRMFIPSCNRIYA